jgi:phosphoribosylformylglycinamidine synthase
MDPFYLKTSEAWLKALSRQSIDHELQVVKSNGLVPGLIELAQASGCGLQLDLDQVDKQEAAALEILKSGRGLLLAVREPDRARQVLEAQGAEVRIIGKLTSLEEFKVYYKGNERAHFAIPLLLMGEGAPVYQREMKKPRNQEKGGRLQLKRIPDRGKYAQVAKELVYLPQIRVLSAGRTSYDFSAGSYYLGESRPCDVQLLDIPNLSKRISLTTSGNPEYLDADPFYGAMIAVATGVRRTTCTGGRALGVGLA